MDICLASMNLDMTMGKPSESEAVSVHGLPENIVLNKGPEFISIAVDKWVYI